MTKIEQWFENSGWNSDHAFTLSKQIEEDNYSEEYHTRTLYFHTDIKGSVVLPKDFSAWLFIGTRKKYDEYISLIKEDEGKIIGIFAYSSYKEWNENWSNPIGNKNDKID